MKKLLGLSVLVLALSLASPALADHNGLPAPAGEPRDGAVDGRTTEITGRVLDIDHKLGALMLQTAQGILALQGPPEAIEGVSVGDVIRVRVALGEEAPMPSLTEELERTELIRR
jgi:hypothetical protein